MVEQTNGDSPKSTEPTDSSEARLEETRDGGVETNGENEPQLEAPSSLEESAVVDEVAGEESSADTEPTIADLQTKIVELERITKRQAEVLGTTIKGMRECESQLETLKEETARSREEHVDNALNTRHLEEVREEYGRMAREVHLITRQVDLLKEHLDDHLSGRKTIDRWKHTAHQRNQKFGEAAGGMAGKSKRVGRMLGWLFLVTILAALAWFFLPDLREKSLELPFLQRMLGDNQTNRTESAAHGNTDNQPESRPVNIISCPDGRDYAQWMQENSRPIDTAWLNHFQNIRTPQALLYLMGTDETRFRSELIMLGREVMSNKGFMAETDRNRVWISLAQTIAGHNSFNLDIYTTRRWGGRQRKVMIPWIKDFTSSQSQKPPADNIYNLWLEIVVDSREKDGIWDRNLRDNLKVTIQRKIPISERRLNRIDSFLDVLRRGVADPLTPDVQQPVKNLFDMESGDYTLQLLGLADHLKQIRPGMEGKAYALNREIEGQKFKIHAEFCRGNQPTPLEEWHRKDTGSPDQAVLMLWLASRLGSEVSDGSPQTVLERLNFFRDNSARDIAETCKL